MRIGITIKLNPEASLFQNGLGQNAMFLYTLLEKVETVDKISLINFNTKVSSEGIAEIDYLKGYNVVNWSDAIDNLDVLITIGMMPSDPDLRYFKNKKNTRIVGYKGGNNLVLATEDLLFSSKWPEREHDVPKAIAYPTNKGVYDEIWMVPQQEYHNKDYFEITYGCPAFTVPFIWSPMFIENAVAENKQIDPNFKILFSEKEFEQWRVASMEPNTSVLKNMMPILHSMEWAYTQEKELFKMFNITNASKFRDHPILMTIASSLQMQRDKKLGFDPRWTVVSLLGNFAEMIISHQWGNPLNYAYLDVVYFGYPLVHNAHLCQDIGYYYSDFNLKDGGDLIVKAAKTHKDNKGYMEEQRKIISRYTIENQNIIDQYKNLLDGLYDESKKPRGSYNWKTNLIE